MNFLAKLLFQLFSTWNLLFAFPQGPESPLSEEIFILQLDGLKSSGIGCIGSDLPFVSKISLLKNHIWNKLEERTIWDQLHIHTDIEKIYCNLNLNKFGRITYSCIKFPDKD